MFELLSVFNSIEIMFHKTTYPSCKGDAQWDSIEMDCWPSYNRSPWLTQQELRWTGTKYQRGDTGSYIQTKLNRFSFSSSCFATKITQLAKIARGNIGEDFVEGGMIILIKNKMSKRNASSSPFCGRFLGRLRWIKIFLFTKFWLKILQRYSPEF